MAEISERVFSAFIRNDLPGGEKILVLELGGERYELLYKRMPQTPQRILDMIPNIHYPQSSSNPGYRPLCQEEIEEVEVSLSLARAA